jgi:hypothetical protein
MEMFPQEHFYKLQICSCRNIFELFRLRKGALQQPAARYTWDAGQPGRLSPHGCGSPPLGMNFRGLLTDSGAAILLFIISTT